MNILNRTVTPEHAHEELMDAFHRASIVYNAGNAADWIIPRMYPVPEASPQLVPIESTPQELTVPSERPTLRVVQEMTPVSGRAIETTITAQQQLIAQNECIAEARRNVIAA